MNNEPQALTVGRIDPAMLDIAQYQEWGAIKKINDDEGEVLFANRLGLVAGRIRDLKKQRDFLTAPIKEAQKRITDIAAAALGPLEGIERTIRFALNEYMHEKRVKAEAAERKRREEHAAQLRAEAESKLEKAAQANSETVLNTAIAAEQQAVRIEQSEVKIRQAVTTESGGRVTQMVTWKWELQDSSQVPRQYLVVDEKALNAIARAYKTNPISIPGVKFFEITTAVVR